MNVFTCIYISNQYSIICLSLLVYNWLVQFSPQFDLFAFTPSIQANGISIGKWATPNVNNQIWSKRVTKMGMKWNGFWWNGEGYARLHLRLNSIIRANSNGNELCVCVPITGALLSSHLYLRVLLWCVRVLFVTERWFLFYLSIHMNMDSSDW